MSHKFSLIYAFLGRNVKPGKKLYLLKVSLVFMLIKSSIATFNYFLIFFLWSVNYTYMVYILCITFGKPENTQTLFGIYLVLTYIERLSRLSFLSSVFAGLQILWVKSVNSITFFGHAQKLWEVLYLGAFSFYGKFKFNFLVHFYIVQVTFLDWPFELCNICWRRPET